MAASVIVSGRQLLGIGAGPFGPVVSTVDARTMAGDPNLPVIAWGAELLASMVDLQDVDPGPPEFDPNRFGPAPP